jgi:alpha-beta hydrolase superfamily lysophospholipase
MPLTALDRPEILRAVFHPRPAFPSTPWGPVGRSLSIEVHPGVTLGARLFAADRRAPAILYWHGNGEIASDYDAVAPHYTRLGLTLVVVDYRGYGTSNGSPTCSNLVSDALSVSRVVQRVLEEQALEPSRLYVMGRSLGSAAAIEVAARSEDALAGLIVESGFADTFALLARLGVMVEQFDESQDGFANASKMEQITMPTLIIHGEDDVLIPVGDARELFQRCAALDKRLVIVPGAGHNDLMLTAGVRYMQAIATFVLGEEGGPA